MAYSELIKSFDRIRSYMRQFYAYGFRTRSEFGEKSLRSYDNERRRMESWLGGFMAFRQTHDGKRVFLSVDSRAIPRNPLFAAFRAKSFTAGDVTFHFYILDLLHDGAALTAQEVAEQFSRRYLRHFDKCREPDLSTIRKKLKEYAALGLLRSEKRGREVVFRLAEPSVDPGAWRDALAFFSEADPLGVIGAFLLDTLEDGPSPFRFKHHYILHALESQIILKLLSAMADHRRVTLTHTSRRVAGTTTHIVLPIRFFVSTQAGRQYLLCYHYDYRKLMFFRLDNIQTVEPGDPEPDYAQLEAGYDHLRRHLWGTSLGSGEKLDHLEMIVTYGPGEDHIPRRLEREKRGGSVVHLDGHTSRFSIDVTDATELIPWLRTFIGRIVKLECSEQSIVDRFYNDLALMAAQYGGDDDAVQ